MTNLRPVPVKVDSELLNRLVEAQRKLLVDQLTNPFLRYGDDPGDYLNAALELFQALFQMVWNQEDLHALEVMLNTPLDYNNPNDVEVSPNYYVPRLCQLACDGICSEIYELNCPALPEDE